MTENQSVETELQPYSDEELATTPSLEEKVQGLMRFFDQYGIDYDKFDPKSKTAYPNFDYQHVPGQHDTQKWLQAVKNIYHQEKNGSTRVNAIRQITAGWNVMETYDFLNWLRFYEEGAHLKYKTAQLWYEGNAPGYFLHVKQDPPAKTVPGVSGHDIDAVKDEVESEMSRSEKKQIIEKQRNKIIGRLDSAEKLLRSEDGQLFAGKELESLMESIYQLKKKIHLVNKLSSTTRLYEDMIIRQANILARDGLVKAAGVLYAVAEEGKVPDPAPPMPPDQPAGDPGGLPSMGPGMPQNPPESAPNDNSPGIEAFLEGLETSNMTTDKDLEVNDTMEVEDDVLMVSEAQAASPEPPPAPTAPPAPKLTEEPLEVKEDDVPAPDAAPKTKDFDHVIDAAFANITVDDVVSKLEDISKIFRTREIPRQLSIVDMMLDALDLASFFPSLSEAINKSLESNNYVNTRIDDILSKLRGTMKSKDLDLKGDMKSPGKPEVAGLKQNLQEQDDKEKARKQMRKDLETKEMEGMNKETPEVDIKEDLGAPPAAPPAPAAPPPPAPPAV